MKINKLVRLKAGGWTTGNTEDFLQLRDGEARLVELKLSLISAVKKITSQTKTRSNHPDRLKGSVLNSD